MRMKTKTSSTTSMMTSDCQKRITRGSWAEDLELNRCHFPIGPRNTWSNAAYPLVGWSLPIIQPGSHSLAIASAMTFLGIGSALYHGFKTTWANKMDWAGMYAVFGALVVHASVPDHPSAAWIMVALGGTFAWLFAFQLSQVDLHAQMGLYLSLTLIPTILLGNATLGWISLALFVIAFSVWQLDKTRIIRLWGHALWHILTAIAIGILYIAR